MGTMYVYNILPGIQYTRLYHRERISHIAKPVKPVKDFNTGEEIVDEREYTNCGGQIIALEDGRSGCSLCSETWDVPYSNIEMYARMRDWEDV